jgi:hypothetical protein
MVELIERVRVNQWDFSHYYLSSLILRQGLDPYTTDLTPLGDRLGMQTGEINRAGYPPTFLLCFEPLTLLAPGTAYWVWFAFNCVAIAAALMLLLHKEDRLDLWTAGFLCALALLYTPVRENFRYAQSQILILLLLVLTMKRLQRGRDASAGLILSWAILLRIYPAVMLGYLVVRRHWLALKWTVIGLAVGSIVTLALVGRASFDFVGRVGFITSRRWYDTPGNVSLIAVVSRLFWFSAGENLNPTMDLIRRLAAIAVEVAVLAVTVKATWMSDSRGENFDQRAYCLWVVATILLAPTAWFHYLVLLLIPLTEISYAASQGDATARSVWTAAASFAIVSAVAIALSLLNPYIDASVRDMIREAEFISLAAAYVAAYWFVHDSGGPTAAAQTLSCSAI